MITQPGFSSVSRPRADPRPQFDYTPARSSGPAWLFPGEALLGLIVALCALCSLLFWGCLIAAGLQ